MSLSDFLKTIDAFQGLAASALERLAASLTVENYRAGTTIIRRGEPGDAMYVIQKGEVLVPILDEHGGRKFTAQLAPGQFFGEMALLTGEPRTADVVADTDCSCVVIKKAQLQPLLGQFPKMAAFLTEILGRRLAESGTIRKVGKYRLIGTLGRGGMARVFEGIHPTIGRPVAIKMLAHEMIYDAEFSERFKNEAKIIAGLKHPNIVEVYDTEEAFATYFIIMEKVEGTDLDRTIRTRGNLGYAEARKVLRQFAAALDYAHAHGIVHRDVKPSNVIVGPDLGVKLMDFGIAQHPTLEQGVPVDAGIIGTPTYMAPEQIQDFPIDGRTDIYALGICAYEMLTGTLPFSHKDPVEILHMHLERAMPNPREKRKDMPEDLVQVVLKATAKEPDKRFQSCGEIVSLLGGPEGTGLDVKNAIFRNLTLVAPKGREKALDDLLREFKARAEGLDGVFVAS